MKNYNKKKEIRVVSAFSFRYLSMYREQQEMYSQIQPMQPHPPQTCATSCSLAV